MLQNAFKSIYLVAMKAANRAFKSYTNKGGMFILYKFTPYRTVLEKIIHRARQEIF